MSKRLLSAGLWLFAGLYAGSMLHGIAGLHELFGPVMGLTVAGLIVVDLPHRLAAGRQPVPVGSEMMLSPDVMTEPA